MNLQAMLSSKKHLTSEIKRRRNKYITEKYHERSVTNRLFK